VTRVLIVAASPVVRAGLEALLARDAAATVGGASAYRPPLVDDGETGEPDVVLIAVESDAEPPLPLALAPDAEPRAPAVVLLAQAPDAAWAAAALRAGARAVLPREASAEEIVAAVEAAAAGLVSVPADLARALVPAAAATRAAPRGPSAPRQPLSPREVEVLGMLTEGLGNKVIAARLGISEHTVKTHVASILAKLDASSRAEAVAIGARLGLIML
jgi:DNA-binding NarL/FixJ family response regulator